MAAAALCVCSWRAGEAALPAKGLRMGPALSPGKDIQAAPWWEEL